MDWQLQVPQWRAQPIDVPCPFCFAPPQCVCLDEGYGQVPAHRLRVMRARALRDVANEAMQRECPTCGADAGDKCVTRAGQVTYQTHETRLPTKRSKGSLGSGAVDQ